MNTILFSAIVLFLIGFLSDLILQVLSRTLLQGTVVNLFEPFWNYFGRLPAAAIAGLLTLIFGGLMLLISVWAFDIMRLNKNSWVFVLFATAVGFILGVIFDLITNRGDYLGVSFRPWYSGMGEENASLWSGGLTFAFTLFVATLILYK